MALEISKMLHLSTAHVTPAVAEALDRHVEVVHPPGQKSDPGLWQSHLVPNAGRNMVGSSGSSRPAVN